MAAKTIYLLDSDLLIGVLRKNRAALAFLQALKPGSYGLSVMTLLEVAPPELMRDARQHRTVQNYLASERFHPLSKAAAQQAVRVQAALLKKNKQMGLPDLAIAATAHELGATLVTRNVSHLSLYPGLKIRAW